MQKVSDILVKLLLVGGALGFGGMGIVLIVAHLWPAPGTRNDLDPWFGALLGVVCLALAIACIMAMARSFRGNGNSS